MSAEPRGEVAIIGMSCVFPGARNLQGYWENIIHKVDAVSDAPPEWEAELYYDPASGTDDRTYCKRGGFLGQLAQFNPVEFGIMPNSVDGTEPDHFLALRAASEALNDAGYDREHLNRHGARTAVIIGRGTYVNRGNSTAIQHSVVLDEVLRVLSRLHPEHTEQELAEIRKQLKASLPPFNADTAPGLVPNIISGRIANRLNLMGTNFLVDAACASSLVAVDHAMLELLAGRCDLAVAGGVHASTPPTILVIFSQLKALSSRGEIRPFDSEADGTLLGEGVGMLVLKRLADAERDGDRIYAVIKGVGVASDGRALGLLAPRLEGEELALRRAYEAAGVGPQSVGLIEAHGTATPVGDAVEVQALNGILGNRRGEVPRCALGSVKSMISHTMPAAGAAGLIKAALALHHKVLPPTLHCEHPNPKLDLANSCLYLNTETRPWIHGSSRTPRRAGVNAFGFGGINAHAVLEEYTGPRQPPWLQRSWDSELFVVSGATSAELLQNAERLLDRITASEDVALKDLAWELNCAAPLASQRLAIVGVSRADLAGKLRRALERLRDGRTKRIRDIEGIYYFSQPLGEEGKLAFLFPGEGAQYENMLADLCLHFPEVREVFDQMDRAFADHPRGYFPSDTIFPIPGKSAERLWTMDAGAEAVFIGNMAMFALVRKLGLQADAMVGHSTGEHSALLASGAILAEAEEELIRHVRGVNEVFENLKRTAGIPQGILLAVAGADHAALEGMVAESAGQLHIALDNCPHQVVLCGTEAAVDGCMQNLAGKAAICQKLPFARAYHTPWFEVFSKPLRAYFETARLAPPDVALYSCVTARRYPRDSVQVRELTSVGWARTVRFRETVNAMYQDGVRIFLEVGPRGNLTAFIDDILRGRPYTAIASNLEHRSGILQIHHMLGQLVAHGVPARLEALYERRAPERTDQVTPLKSSLPLATGLQPARLPQEFNLPAEDRDGINVPAPLSKRPSVPRSATTPVRTATTTSADQREAALEAHFRTMQKFLETQTQVMHSYLARKRAPVMPVSQPGVAPADTVAAEASNSVKLQPERRAARPFVSEVRELVPRISARVLHRFSLDREPMFQDHTLGRYVSEQDPALGGLPVVPFTITMEALAETAELLQPGLVLTGVRDFRAHRWITLESGEVGVEVTAEQRADGAVQVAMRGEGSRDELRPVWAEGTMLFSKHYPAPPAAAITDLPQASASRWQPEALYTDGMFHGPSFRSVQSMDQTGPKGAAAKLGILQRDVLISGFREPPFLADPIVLDGAGQVVAFWSQECVNPTRDVFPYQLAALDCFGPLPLAGEQLECRVQLRHVSDKDLQSDIEIIRPDGAVLYRLTGWADRCFQQSRKFWQMRTSPRSSYLSTEWIGPLAESQKQTPLVCCRLDGLSDEFFETAHGIWPKVLAHLVLSRKEREQWLSMKASDKRRRDWLLGRCAAKDAVRILLKQSCGLEVPAADVEIITDRRGVPQVAGDWTTRFEIRPKVSISHTCGMAAALAVLHADCLAGIDIEALGAPRADIESVAFSARERSLLDALDPKARHAWSLRFWCAKEALAKALGIGLGTALEKLSVGEVCSDTGQLRLWADGVLPNGSSPWKDKPLTAYTSIAENIVSALVCEPIRASKTAPDGQHNGSTGDLSL